MMIQPKILITINQNNQLLEAIQFMTTLSKSSKQKKIQQVMSEEELEVPQKVVKKESSKTERMFCQNHSSALRKQEIKFINIGFVGKNKPNFHQTFMCDVCYQQFKTKNPHEKLKSIKTLQQFKYKYIQSVFDNYSQFGQGTNTLLEKAEYLFCSQIDNLNEDFKKRCQVYKKNVRQFFQTIRKPIKVQHAKQFISGNFNEGMIQDLYKNYHKVKRFNSLIGPNNKEIVQTSLEGLKASFENIKNSAQQDMNKSFQLIKLYIEKFEEQKQKTQFQQTMMIPQIEQKNETIRHHQQRVNQVRQNTMDQKNKNSKSEKQNESRRKNKIQENQKSRRIRESLSSSSSSQSSSDSSDDSSEKNHDKTKTKSTKQAKQSKNQKKTKSHLIQKYKKLKPAKLDNIIMIAEEFQKNSGDIVALFIVHKAHSEISGAQRIFRLEIQEFKRRYSMAFNRYIIKSKQRQ